MGRCQGSKNDGTQCSRDASKKKSDDPRFCWQHQKCMTPNDLKPADVQTQFVSKVKIQIAKKGQNVVAPQQTSSLEEHEKDKIIINESPILQKTIVNDKYKAMNQIQKDKTFLVAVHMGLINDVARLIDNGANVKYLKNKALIDACQLGRTQIVEYLLNHGANLHERSDKPLRMASMKGHEDIIKILLERGANVNAKNGSPLFNAAENGHVECAALLIKNGAKPESSNVTEDGQVIISLAIEKIKDEKLIYF